MSIYAIPIYRVLLCSPSQKLNSTHYTGSGYCRIFDLAADDSSRAEIKCSCVGNDKKSALLGEYQSVTQLSQSSVSQLIQHSAADSTKHVLVFNQYHSIDCMNKHCTSDNNHVHAIALHLVPEFSRKNTKCHTTRYGNPPAMLDNETKNGFKYQRLFIEFNDQVAKNFAFDFKYVFDLGGRTLTIYNEKDAQLKRRVIFGHMCTSLDKLSGSIGRIKNPRAILLTYRELIAFEDDELVSAQLDNEQRPSILFVALRSGKIYSIQIKHISNYFISQSKHSDCSGYEYAPWAKLTLGSPETRPEGYPSRPYTRCGKVKMGFSDDLCSLGLYDSDWKKHGFGSGFGTDRALTDDIHIEKHTPVLRIQYNIANPLSKTLIHTSKLTNLSSMRALGLPSDRERIYVFLLAFAQGGQTIVSKVRWKWTTLRREDGKEYYQKSEPGSLKFLHSNEKLTLLAKSTDGGVDFITKPTADCSSYKNCLECLADDADPQCHWSMKGKCEAEDTSDPWNKMPNIRKKKSDCPIFVTEHFQKSISQKGISDASKLDAGRNEPIGINFPIKNLLLGQMENPDVICVWQYEGQDPCFQRSRTINTRPTRRPYSNEYSCVPPMKPDSKSCGTSNDKCNPECAPTPTVNLTVGLALKEEPIGQNPAFFVSTTLTYVKCEEAKSCRSCLHFAEAQCNWCHVPGKCVAFEGNCAHVDKISDQIDQCPYYNITQRHFFHKDTERTLQFDLKNSQKLSSGTESTKFSYKLETSGGSYNGEARKENEKIVLLNIDEGLFRKPQPSPRKITHLTMPKDIRAEYTVKVTILATIHVKESGETYDITVDPDSDGKDYITVYDCPSTYGCGDCLSLPSEYKCRYQSCSNRQNSHCLAVADQVPDKCNILSPEKPICPIPKIESVSPSNATKSGKTTVLIIGQDFHPNMGVLFGNRKCSLLNPTPNSRRGISCDLEAKPCDSNEVEEDVRIILNNHPTDQSFSFKKPRISNIYPEQLLRIGQTKITIDGESLDVGSEMTIQIKQSSQTEVCSIISRAARRVVCEVGKIEPIDKFNGESQLEVKIDDSCAIRKADNQPVKIAFVDLPTITAKPLYAIKDGGSPLIFSGDRSNLLPPKKVKLVVNGNYHNCLDESETAPTPTRNQLFCHAPPEPLNDIESFGIEFADEKISINQSEKMAINYVDSPTFDTDKVPSYTNFNQLRGLGIAIRGSGFCLGQKMAGTRNETECDKSVKDWAQDKLYTINIVYKGDDQEKVSPCPEPISISDSELRCKMENAEDFEDLESFDVEVIIGKWRQSVFEVNLEPSWINTTVISASIGMVFVLIVVLACCILYRRKKRHQLNQQQQAQRLIEEKNQKEVIKHGVQDLLKTMAGEQSDSPYNTMQLSKNESICKPFRFRLKFL